MTTTPKTVGDVRRETNQKIKALMEKRSADMDVFGALHGKINSRAYDRAYQAIHEFYAKQMYELEIIMDAIMDVQS